MKILSTEKAYVNRKIEEYYLCPGCGNIYQIKGTASYDINRIRGRSRNIRIFDTNLSAIYCKKCNEYAFRCDKHIVEIIRDMNKIGLKTWVCCSGHFDIDHSKKQDKISNAYIGFIRKYPAIKRYFDENGGKIKYWTLCDESCNIYLPHVVESYTLKINIDPIYEAIRNEKSINKRISIFKNIRRKYLRELRDMINTIKSYGDIETPTLDFPDDGAVLVVDGKRYELNDDCIYPLADDGKHRLGFYKLYRIIKNLDKLEHIKNKL